MSDEDIEQIDKQISGEGEEEPQETQEAAQLVQFKENKL